MRVREKGEEKERGGRGRESVMVRVRERGVVGEGRRERK